MDFMCPKYKFPKLFCFLQLFKGEESLSKSVDEYLRIGLLQLRHSKCIHISTGDDIDILKDLLILCAEKKGEKFFV